MGIDDDTRDDSGTPTEDARVERPGPIGGDMAAVLFGLAQRLRLPALMERHASIPVLGLFSLINGFLSIGLMAGAAWVTGAPFIFPSLGADGVPAVLHTAAACGVAANTVLGHLIGVGAGYLSLALFGLLAAPPALATSVTTGRVMAAALSLGLTSGAMVWARVPHPPAGATTLIVSLGILREPWQLAVLMLAVVLLTVQGFVINRLAGIP